MNLIINIVLDDKNNMVAYFYTNGENRLAAFPFKNPKIIKHQTNPYNTKDIPQKTLSNFFINHLHLHTLNRIVLHRLLHQSTQF